MSPPEAAAGLTLEVESLAHGGDGVARDPDGRVVFVPRTAPGDVVRARLTEERERWARARVVEVLSPGPTRREAPCPFYRECGGCQLQHVEPAEELESKRRAVRDTLERIGGIRMEVPPPVTAGSRLGYRNRVSLTLRRPPEGGVTAGYHGHEDPDRLVDVDRCPLAEPPVNDAWRSLRECWGPGASLLPGGGEVRITVRATADGETGIVLEGGDEGDPGDPAALEEELEGVAACHWRPSGAGRRRLYGRERLRERWRGREIGLRPWSFLQVNRAVAHRMEDHLDRLVEPVGPGRRILDLYAGLGLRALRWSEAGAETAACEEEPDAVADGREAAAAADAGVDVREGRVEDHLPDLLPADVAVVNPPRTGLSRQVCRILGDARLDALIYVSCEPSTLARDLDRLEEGWEPVSVQPFDAFPQTAHVETVVRLERRP